MQRKHCFLTSSHLLITDEIILQKELDSLTVSILARKYIITRNISKAFLNSRDTLLYRNYRLSSSITVLPVLTQYSPEGRQFSKSVRNRWHIIEKDLLPTNTANNNHLHDGDQYATLSQPTHTSQLAHTLWWRWLHMPHGCFHQPKAHLYVIVVTYFMFFDTLFHPLSFRITKNVVSQTTRFELQTVDLLNYMSAFSRQENWMHQTTWPHSTNQLRFHSTKGHYDTFYASYTPPFK